MEAANVAVDQKRNILAHVKADNPDVVYDDMKSAIRLIKGSLVEGTKEGENPAETFAHEEVNFSRNDGARRSRSR